MRFEGAVVGQPSTNNGVEAMNATLKREYTMRDRLQVGQFLNPLINIVKEWSEARNPSSPNCVKFCSRPTASMKTWTNAFQRACDERTVIEEPNGKQGCVQYYTASSTSKKPILKKTLADFKAKNGTWKTFNEFRLIIYLLSCS